MKKLYIVRHAKSSWEDFQINDFDRPLNTRGLNDAQMMGKKFKELGFISQFIISSSANRALTTARILSDNMAINAAKIIESKDLYLAEPSSMIKLINESKNEINSLMLVGHNPGMTQLINYLTGENLYNLPTCALSGIQFDVDDWKALSVGLGKQFAYEYPKKYK